MVWNLFTQRARQDRGALADQPAKCSEAKTPMGWVGRGRNHTWGWVCWRSQELREKKHQEGLKRRTEGGGYRNSEPEPVGILAVRKTTNIVTRVLTSTKLWVKLTETVLTIYSSLCICFFIMCVLETSWCYINKVLIVICRTLRERRETHTKEIVNP